MQDAFDESLAEHTGGLEVLKPKLRVGDAKTRRDRLLNEGKDEGPPAAYWRYRPGQKNHELRRLLAQISFGVHLLLNGSATAIESVVQILQGHIDEVDEFLEMTLEDMALATKDLQERLDHLRLPMNNMAVFEKMLEDRQFRLRILDGNEAIEHIVSRTTTALAQTVEDVDEGLKSTREFAAYLTEQHYGGWRDEQPGIVTIFEAMKGNTEGWLNAFADLHAKDNALHVLTLQLSGVVSEMELTAGEVSRRTRVSMTQRATSVLVVLTCSLVQHQALHCAGAYASLVSKLDFKHADGIATPDKNTQISTETILTAKLTPPAR